MTNTKTAMAKLEIELFDKSFSDFKEDYKRERLRYIDSFEEYVPGGFLRSGYYKKNPSAGEASWNRKYPNGYRTWLGRQGYSLNNVGQQNLINKINEIIDYINSKENA